MKKSDKELGMDRTITRRDLLYGMAATAAGAALPAMGLADAGKGATSGKALAGTTSTGNQYPPALTGLRGNHDGSFGVAHALALEGKTDWGTVAPEDDTEYDLLVVGGGTSGLAAAHFYRQEHPDARILILDNHDDFGGHSKRNEFIVDGKTLIGYGGTQSLEEPSDYEAPTKQLLRDLGVELSRFESAYDHDFYRRHGLEAAVFFNRRDWGQDKLVRFDLGGLRSDSYVPLAEQSMPTAELVQQMPMSAAARAEMLRLVTARSDHMPEIAMESKEDYLYTLTYKQFLQRHMGIREPEVFDALKDLAVDNGVGIEAASAGGSILYSGLPGYEATGLPDIEGEPYIYHFPDGNASITRLLVRKMIPGVAPGDDMDDIVTAPFDYGALDNPEALVRLRLNSTAVRVVHDGDPATSKRVHVVYVKNGMSHRVTGKACVLACFNAIIPGLAPELPEVQREALAGQVRAVTLYTNVALKNWRAWKKLGIGGVSCPGGFHTNAMLDYPVSMRGYQFSGGPDEPVVVHMERFFYAPDSGLSRRDQYRAGRAELLATPWETIERNVRSQLTDMLSGGGFDPAEDIAGITVNRWAHGYSYMYDFTEEPYYPDWNDERYPHVRARKPFGRITIANADSAANPSINGAVTQAYRAVRELG